MALSMEKLAKQIRDKSFGMFTAKTVVSKEGIITITITPTKMVSAAIMAAGS